MPDGPSEDDAPNDSAFERTLRNLANMPHKPHDEMKKGREPKPAPKPSKP
jgi:hypothetical protein